VLANVGRAEEGAELLREALKLRIEVLGPKHRLVADTRSGLAWALGLAGQTDEAVTLLHQALADQEAAMGAEHPDVAVVCEDLASVYLTRGEPQRAEPFYRRALQIRTKEFGSDYRRTADVQAALSHALVLLDRVPEALELARAAFASHREAFPDGKHPTLMRTRSLLGLALLRSAEYEAARAELEAAWAVQQAAEADVPPYERAETAFWLARALASGSAPDLNRARRLARSAIEGFEDAGPAREDDVLRVRQWLTAQDG
jgi:tetratricopeptide (TPR) repeat protein